MVSNYFSKPIKIGITLIAAITVIFSAFYVMQNNVSAQGQETCPQTGDWVKVDNINAQSYEYTAPEGKQIVETCYKASTTLVYKDIEPPLTEVKIESKVLNPEENAYHNISHASFRLEDISETPTPTSTFTSTPTVTFTPTPTQTQETPTPTSTPPNEDVSDLILSSECLGNGNYRWTVTNPNSFAVAFSWKTTNGAEGNQEVAQNSAISFTTSGNATTMTISYVINEEVNTVETNVEICQAEDPTPDEHAGGTGPSLLSILPLVLASLSVLGILTGIGLKNKVILS